MTKRFNLINHVIIGQRRFHRGFTLVESFVAIAILAMALVGPLSIAASSLASSRYARDQVTASYLAQEAAEYIRGIRDNNHFLIQKGSKPRDGWLDGLTLCLSEGGCVIDTFDDTIDEADYCGLSECPLKYYDGIYGYGLSWPDSIFTRTIEITPSSSHEAVILVTVSWKSGSLPEREIKLRSLIFNW